jgi:CRP-like cAMP-binding protein
VRHAGASSRTDQHTEVEIMLNAQSRPLNHLLAALPLEDYRRISRDLSFGERKVRHNLQRRGEPLRDIYFPSRSLCSLSMTMADGAAAEIAMVGSEGLIGVEAGLGLTLATCDATVQIAGDGVGHTMTVDAFRRELDQGGALYSIVKKYTRALVGFVEQSVACNGLHAADARCCRWLLSAQDRLASEELPLTHELLSSMLGVRRPTVTLIIADLIRLGIISTSRGVIRITVRAELEARSCECYKTVKILFDNLLLFDAKELQEDFTSASWLEPAV